jgi:hypothetical protein
MCGRLALAQPFMVLSILQSRLMARSIAALNYKLQTKLNTVFSEKSLM